MDDTERDLLKTPQLHISEHYRTLEASLPLPEQRQLDDESPLHALLSSLDLQETSEQLIAQDPDSRFLSLDYQYAIEPISLTETVFRHSGWKANRQRIWAAMLRSYNEGSMGRHRLHNFANCGSGTYIQLAPDDGQVRLVGNYCHDRLCIVCQAAKAKLASQVLANHCDGKQVRFVTLTIRHSNTPLKAQISRILAAFHALRRTELWKNTVEGGAYLFECKYIPETHRWHPHLHILAQTPWLPQKELSEAWHNLTGDSYIVDVRPINDQHELACYVCKYCGKAIDTEVYRHPAALDEYIKAIRSVRTLSTFGSWRGLKLRPKTSSTVKWINVGRLDNLLDRARMGERYARRWIEAVLRTSTQTEDAHVKRKSG